MWGSGYHAPWLGLLHPVTCEYVITKRPSFGLRWLWRLIGGEVSS